MDGDGSVRNPAASVRFAYACGAAMALDSTIALAERLWPALSAHGRGRPQPPIPVFMEARCVFAFAPSSSCVCVAGGGVLPTRHMLNLAGRRKRAQY